MKALLRYFSYVCHGLLAAFLIAVSSLALMNGAGSLRLDVLPWTGSTLTYIVFGGGIFGLITVILALLGSVRWLFFIWSLVVAVLMVKGFVFSSYHFEPGRLSWALGFIAAAWLSVAGAWFQIRVPRRELKRY